MKNTLIKIFGNWLDVLWGDTMVLDRYLWLRRNLPKTKNGESLLDVGCGSGAFTIESAKRGYKATGISWDKENQNNARKIATILNIENQCLFPTGDARKLDALVETEKYDYVINFENIEHIINDSKLIRDIFNTLKPGGVLLLTTPYLNYYPMSVGDLGPFSKVEDGGHVRRGYNRCMLNELCELSGLKVEKIDYCSGIGSQFATKILRQAISIFGYKIGWFITLPFRPLAFLLELLNFRGRPYSICLVAYKPRF